MPVPDVTMMSAVLGSINGIVQLTKTMVGLRDATMIEGELAKLYPLVTTAQKEVLAAYESQLELLKRNSELEAEAARLKDWSAEKQTYKFDNVRPGLPSFIPKDTVPGAEPEHRLCANCFSRGQKTYLQRKFVPNGRVTFLVCQTCRSEMDITHDY